MGPITWRGDALVKRNIENEYHPNDEAYVFAVADAMRHEYRAIVDAGFVLQLDAPRLIVQIPSHRQRHLRDRVLGSAWLLAGASNDDAR